MGADGREVDAGCWGYDGSAPGGRTTTSLTSRRSCRSSARVRPAGGWGRPPRGWALTRAGRRWWSRRQLRALLEGRHPVDGRHCGPPARASRVAAYDLTFSAPKSASVLFALGGEETAPLGSSGRIPRRWTGRCGTWSVTGWAQCGARAAEQREVIETTGFAGAVFTHGVNRNLDPHLHSHVVVVNAVHGVDGRWSAIDQAGADAHRRAAGAVYDAHLRAGLTASLGVRWEGPPGRAWRSRGGAGAARRVLVTRGRHPDARAPSTGVRSARGAAVAWAATRPPAR